MTGSVFKARIGISTGDIVRTSYGTGGVIVDIVGPFHGNVHGPVFTIVYVKAEESPRDQDACRWINDVYRDETGIYHCGPGDTLAVEANPNAPAQAMSLFDVLEEAGAQ